VGIYLAWYPKERHSLKVEFFGLACFLVPFTEAKTVPFLIETKALYSFIKKILHLNEISCFVLSNIWLSV